MTRRLCVPPRALTIFEDALGPEHAYTRDAARDLATCMDMADAQHMDLQGPTSDKQPPVISPSSGAATPAVLKSKAQPEAKRPVKR